MRTIKCSDPCDCSLFIYLFIYLNQATWPIRNMNMTDRDRK